MKNGLFVIARVLVIMWAIGFYTYNAGPVIHLLLPGAITAVILGIIARKDF